MATLVKNHGRYYVQFYLNDRTPSRKRVALKTTDKRQALKLQRRLENAFAENRFDPWVDDPRTLESKDVAPVSISQALDLFLAEREKEEKSPNTLRSYRNVVKLFMKSVGPNLPLGSLRTCDVETFVRDQAVSANTRANRFRHLRAFLRWAKREGLTPRSPIDDLVSPQQTDKVPKAIRLEELETVCAALTYRAAWRVHLFRFAYYTGMRSSELGRLRWNDIDHETQLVTIHKQKNRKAQTIPLNSKAASVLAEIRGVKSGYVFRPEGQKLQRFVDATSRAFKRAKDRAGITRPLTFHSTRHGFCTALAEAGKSAMIIQAAARHADIATSARYVHIANEALKAELEDVFG